MQQTALLRGSGRPNLPAVPSALGSRPVGRPRATQLSVRAAGSNGRAHGVHAPPAHPQAVEMLEMVVADDLRPPGAQQRRPSKRLVPAPHQATPTVAVRPPPKASSSSNGGTISAAAVEALNGLTGTNGNGRAEALSGSNGSSSSGSKGFLAALNGSAAQLPPAVQQLLARQAGNNKATTAELALAQRQVVEQQRELKSVRTELARKDSAVSDLALAHRLAKEAAVELKSTRAELAVKDAEVMGLRQELAERDGKLKAARADSLESRMLLQQKDVELKTAMAQLSEAVRDRSQLRSQLAQTHTELAETRAELEQLADDILAIKLLMDDEGELDFSDPSLGGFEVNGGADGGYSFYADEAEAYGAGAGGASGASDDTLDVLESLLALSRQLAADAAEDDAAIEAADAVDEMQPADEVSDEEEVEEGPAPAPRMLWRR